MATFRTIEDRVTTSGASAVVLTVRQLRCGLKMRSRSKSASVPIENCLTEGVQSEQ